MMNEAFKRKFTPSKTARREFAQKMSEIDDYCKKNYISQSASNDSYYFDVDGQNYRVSNHSVEASRKNSDGKYHDEGRKDDVIYIHAGKTRLIDIHKDLLQGKKLDGNGNIITEDIKSPIHNELNIKLWEGDDLISEIKDKLLQIADNFIEYLEKDDIQLKMKDVLIIGSNANYNYTKESDIDLHIIVDMSDIKDEEEKRLLIILYNAYRVIFNSKYDVKIKGHEVEIYVEPDNTSTKSGGVFSLLNGWIRKPDKEVFNDDEVIDKEYEIEFKKWKDKYNELIANTCVPIDESLQSIDTLTVYNGSRLLVEDFKNINLMSSTEIGVHCGTKSAVKSLGYKYMYEIKLGNFNVLELDFDMQSEWAVPELSYRLSTDESEIKMLLTKLRTFSHRRDKREQYSKVFRDFILEKEYNLISYVNEVEDKGTVSYIIIDTSVILDAKLVSEENISSLEVSKLEKIKQFITDLMSLRKTALEKSGENSVGNRIFKQFRRLGYIKSLRDAKISFEEKDMSLESLDEEVGNISEEELFWNLRDGLVDEKKEFLNKTKYSESASHILKTLEGNLYLNKGKIDTLHNPDNMFAVSPEQYPKHVLDKSGMLKFKDAVKGKFVMFYNSSDDYGKEYSVLTANEELCIKACKGELGDEFAKQRSYAKYVKGEYQEVVVNNAINLQVK